MRPSWSPVRNAASRVTCRHPPGGPGLRGAVACGRLAHQAQRTDREFRGLLFLLVSAHAPALGTFWGFRSSPSGSSWSAHWPARSRAGHDWSLPAGSFLCTELSSWGGWGGGWSCTAASGCYVGQTGLGWSWGWGRADVGQTCAGSLGASCSHSPSSVIGLIVGVQKFLEAGGMTGPPVELAL